jgi:hypothetical protein
MRSVNYTVYKFSFRLSLSWSYSLQSSSFLQKQDILAVRLDVLSAKSPEAPAPNDH